MAVYVNNITINTGAYFSKDFYLDNIDGSSLNLAGYGASSYVRKHPSSLNTAAEFTVGFVDRDNGRIRLSLSSEDTAKIKPGRYVYDVLARDSGNIPNIIIEGSVLAREDYTTECVKTSYQYEGYAALPTDSHIGLDGSTGYTNLSIPTTPYWNTVGLTSMTNYGVVSMGHWHNSCNNMDTLTTNLQNSAFKTPIDSYINNGGVIFYIGEYNGCGDTAAHNTRLGLLGTSMRLGNSHQMVTSAQLAISSNNLPTYWSHAATNIIIEGGGTALYTVGSVTTVAYEKVGSGAIVLVADSNGTSKDPSAFYAGFRELVNPF